jgi:ATP-dependent helicase/nuclease subunit A
VGVKYQHIMVDEFQDTSPIQFQIFLPLLANCLDTGGTIMLVGDAKQGIYGFRGGDYRQITYLKDQQYQRLAHQYHFGADATEQLTALARNQTVKQLETNFRSDAEIVKFNNRFFEYIRSNATLTERSSILDNVFDANLSQKWPPNAVKAGWVSFQFLPAKDTEAEDNLEENEENGDLFDQKSMPDRVLEIIQNCIADGVALGQIAVLCNTNKEAKIISKILKYNGIEISTSESLLIKLSPGVQLIEAFLQLTLAPNMAQRFACLCLFYEHIIKAPLPSQLTATAIELSGTIDNFENYFLQYGYSINELTKPTTQVYEYVLKTIEIFDLWKSSLPDFLYAFLDQVLLFETKNGKNTAAFLEFWQLKRDTLSVQAAGANAITVCTIHKAKGLQYPVVIMPYAHWALKPRSGQNIWVATSIIPDIELLTDKTHNQKLEAVNIKYNSKEQDYEGIEVQKNDYIESHFLEAINKLYVGFTRAQNSLYVIGKHKPKSYTGAIADFVDISDILYNYLIYSNMYCTDKLQFDIATQKRLLPNNRNGANKTMYIVPNSVLHQLPQVAQRSAFESVEIQWGNLIHQILAKVFSYKDLPQVLQNIFAAQPLPNTTKTELSQILGQLMQLPTIKPYFAENILVKNELEIVNKEQVFIADRVVFLPKTTVIIDYKTGAQEAEHRQQIKNYGRLIQQLGYPDVQLLLVYLEPMQVIQVPLE